MSPTIEIKLTVPEGTTVEIGGLQELGRPGAGDPGSAIHRYFTEYLSENGRTVFAAAAQIENFHGRPGFTFDDLARNLRVPYGTVKSWHRTSGRSAKRWRRETGSPEPIFFEWVDYAEVGPEGGERTMYRLPEQVAEVIRDLPVFQG
jgi:hypothetical protein